MTARRIDEQFITPLTPLVVVHCKVKRYHSRRCSLGGLPDAFISPAGSEPQIGRGLEPRCEKWPPLDGNGGWTYPTDEDGGR